MRGSAVARLMGLRFRIPPGSWLIFSCEWCVLSGWDFCVGLITRPEEFCRMWCVWVWSWNQNKEETLVHWGLSCHRKILYSCTHTVQHSIRMPRYTVVLKQSDNRMQNMKLHYPEIETFLVIQDKASLPLRLWNVLRCTDSTVMCANRDVHCSWILHQTQKRPCEHRIGSDRIGSDETEPRTIGTPWIEVAQ